MELHDVPAWMVDSDTFVIGAEKLFEFLYFTKGSWQLYRSTHPLLDKESKIVKSGPLTGYVYTLESTTVLTLKAAEYICKMGIDKMQYSRFVEFIRFVGEWKRRKIPTVRNVDLFTVTMLESNADTMESAKEPTLECAKEPTMESATMKKSTKDVSQTKPTVESTSPSDTKLRDIMTAVPLNNTACLPEFCKTLLNEYIELRTKFTEERDRKDKLIEELIRQILSM